MKSKIFKIVFQILILVVIVGLIFVFGDDIYKFAVSNKIIKTQEEIASEQSAPTIANTDDSIENILQRLYPIDASTKYIKTFSSTYNGIEAYINEEDVSIVVRSEVTEKFSGLISNSYFSGNTAVRTNITTSKRVKNILVGYYLDVLSVEFMEDVPYIFFLMEDGTVEYIDLKTLFKNGYFSNSAVPVRTKGAIKGLNDIIKLEQCNLANEEEGYSTAVAIDKTGQIYNLFEYIPWGK